MNNKREFEVTNKRFLNFKGRNLMKGYNITYPNINKKEKLELAGYGISKKSEKIDELEAKPMNKLQETLSKIQIKF